MESVFAEVRQFGIEQKLIWYRQKQVDVARESVSSQQKKVDIAQKNYFMSTKTR